MRFRRLAVAFTTLALSVVGVGGVAAAPTPDAAGGTLSFVNDLTGEPVDVTVLAFYRPGALEGESDVVTSDEVAPSKTLDVDLPVGMHSVRLTRGSDYLGRLEFTIEKGATKTVRASEVPADALGGEGALVFTHDATGIGALAVSAVPSGDQKQVLDSRSVQEGDTLRTDLPVGVYTLVLADAEGGLYGRRVINVRTGDTVPVSARSITGPPPGERDDDAAAQGTLVFHHDAADGPEVYAYINTPRTRGEGDGEGHGYQVGDAGKTIKPGERVSVREKAGVELVLFLLDADRELLGKSATFQLKPGTTTTLSASRILGDHNDGSPTQATAMKPVSASTGVEAGTDGATPDNRSTALLVLAGATVAGAGVIGVGLARRRRAS